MPEISVIICTYNPDRALLRQVVNAIAPQLESTNAELILIDNNSANPVRKEELGAASHKVQINQEKRQGLAFARAKGIALSNSNLLVFVDDDNVIDPEYLKSCLNTATGDPSLGVVAGRSTGAFSRAPGRAIRPHLERYAVRDLGDEMLYLSGKQWGLGEPYGAGMMVRKEIADAFVELIKRNGDHFQLGRNGDSLASGEDTLFSRLACKLGFRVAYDPKLHLTHVISPKRLTLGYLLRLLEAQAASHAVLESICGRCAPKPNWPLPVVIFLRFCSRLINQGPCDAFTSIWLDRGELYASRKIRKYGLQFTLDLDS